MRPSFLLMLAASVVLLACGGGVPPTWAPGTEIEVFVPEQAAPDGKYVMTVRVPTAVGRRHVDFDQYVLYLNGEERASFVELTEPPRRPAYRAIHCEVSGDQHLEVVAGDYTMKARVSDPLVLQVTAPPAREALETPKATAESPDPLGRSHIALPLKLDRAARVALNRALREPGLSLREIALQFDLEDNLHSEAMADLTHLLAACVLAHRPAEQVRVVANVQLSQGASGYRPRREITAEGGPEALGDCLTKTLGAWEAPIVDRFGVADLTWVALPEAPAE